MKNELIVIPIVKVHPNRIILYNEFHYTLHRPRRKNITDDTVSALFTDENEVNSTKQAPEKFLKSSRTSGGILSKQAKKKLSTAIEYFLLLNKPQNNKSGNTGRHYENKIAFITLTLPSKQLHTDNEIKEKCLNQFLIEIHKRYKISNYIWRAEYQKNGNIHFHILVNKFIPWNDVRNRWNRIINKLGYVDNYRLALEKYHKKGFQVREDLLKKWSAEKQKQAYEKGKKSDWNNPNSIDVHGINNISNIKSYITKYMSKNENDSKNNSKNPLENRKKIGRIWSASTVFSNIKGATQAMDSQLEDNLRIIEKHFKNSFYTGDYFTIIDISIAEIEKLGCKNLIQMFYSYMFFEFEYSHQFVT